jgi:hypothetical protein
MEQTHLHGSKDTLQNSYLSCVTVDTVGKKIALNGGDWICWCKHMTPAVIYVCIQVCMYVLQVAQRKIAKIECLLKNIANMYLKVLSPFY